MTQKLKVAAARPTYWEQVKFQIPGDMGKSIEIKFKAEFHRLTSDERKHIVENHLGPEKGDDKAVLEKVLANWDGLSDQDDQPFVCHAENREQANQDWPGFEAAIVAAWLNTTFKAAGKN